MPGAAKKASYRLALTAGLVFGLQNLLPPAPAFAQSNPLEKASENPFDRQAARTPYEGPDLDLPVRLEGDGLTVEFDALDHATATLSGRVQMGGQAYPLTGRFESTTRMTGAFKSGGQPYEFVLEGDAARGYAFRTGSSTYVLRSRDSVPKSGGSDAAAADPALLRRASDAMKGQDFREALRIARPLAEQGHVGASYTLGICAGFGLGTAQDLGLARNCFETAARGEHPSALYELGVMSEEGLFGDPDNASAIAYFERSARLGTLGGMMAYGEMLLNGLGRETDFVEGIAWVGVAAKRGYEDAQGLIDHYNQDKSVSQQDRERVTARTAELDRTLPDASKLDDLIDYNRFVRPAAAGGSRKSDDAPAPIDPLAGEWTGTLTEVMDDGQSMRAPMTLRITGPINGSYAADVVVSVQMPAGDGSMVDVRASGAFTGQLTNGRASLRAADTTATIVHTGESASMGPQQMELSVNGSTISGRLGNEYEGFSQFQATRNAPQKGATQNPTGWGGAAHGAGGGAETELGRPGAAGRGVFPAASVTLEPVTLTDPQMDNAPSHTLLVPQGWQQQGGVRWNQPQLYLDMVHLDLRVTAPDGAAYGYYPGATYTWSDIHQINAQMGIPAEIPQPGQITGDGLMFMPMPQTTGEYVQTMLIPQHRPGATDVQVTEAQEMPDVLATMREMLSPTLQSLQQHNRTMGQMGGGQMDMPLFADRVRVTYRENGRMFEEDVYVTGYAVITRMPLSNGVVTTMARWGVEDVRMVRTPAGGSPNQTIADAASLSVRPDPKWLATVMQLKAQINKTVSDGIIERGRINREAMQKSFEIHQESVRSRQASNDRMHHQFINYIRDVEDYKTPSGQTLQLPSHYNNAYMNGQGNVIMTNSPLPNSSGWTQLNRATP